jgi:tRNA modification GTPase
MTLAPSDTIVALATAPGPGARAVVRLSGPLTRSVVAAVFTPHDPAPARPSRGHLCLPGLHAPLPADVYSWPGPHSYTGQDVAEIHTISSPPLIDALIGALIRAGARPAGPGEFTLRAFLTGKLDLPRAEAVHGVVAAADRGQLRDALAQLAGGMSTPLTALRDDLLSLLADLEAGLDFVDEDIEFATHDQTLLRLGAALGRLTAVRKQLEGRSLADRPYRAVLVGVPNAGKSSLFNALTGRRAALVSPVPGTTRDYLVRKWPLGDVTIELVDTAGLHDPADAIDRDAQALGLGQAGGADLLLACVPPGGHPPALPPGPDVLLVGTMSDLGPPPPGALPCSATTGAGLAELRDEVARRARARLHPPLAPGLARCRGHIEECLKFLGEAHATCLNGGPPEILAFEVRGALDRLGEVVGAVYTDDLLDRIFSRFCIGK